MKILFQGDSITDAGRDKRNYHNMGNGYPKYASQLIANAYPDRDFEFINLGISGNRTDQLFDRLYRDALSLEPDLVSVLIGINDIWHRYGNDRIMTSDEQLLLNYRRILTELKEKTNAKIVMLSPYVLDCDEKEHMRKDLCRVLPGIRELAKEFADAYVPLDLLFAEVVKTQPEPHFYSADGVHPNQNGAAFIGARYAEAVIPLL